ncbi:Ubiquitin carboxyl-terminal hydrolase [Zalerion maritima]|uniref:Ubiquitin carboxyl-terminal hydrolase n=1 Tax=Zalerion maritima TaxID=339359 RepID=A0AAD5RNP0_9PEZI|nr:Ubiquitin carboxyl-terminal hydrolase [Zalerion maritima]
MMADPSSSAAPTSVHLAKSEGRISFVPLEANPELLTQLAHKLGLSPALQFCDVFSLTEPEMLGFIPRPALALLLVFPISKEYEEYRATEDEGKELDPEGGKGEKEPVWIRQTIRNACGLMAMLHGMLNGTAREFITPDSTLSTLLSDAIPASYSQRSKLLETDEFMAKSYGEVAVRGDTAAPDAKDDLDLHYVCFVKGTPDAQGKSRLWELDGRRKGPLMRMEGLGLEDDILTQEALEKGPLKFLQRAGGDMRFSCVALVQG